MPAVRECELSRRSVPDRSLAGEQQRHHVIAVWRNGQKLEAPPPVPTRDTQTTTPLAAAPATRHRLRTCRSRNAVVAGNADGGHQVSPSGQRQGVRMALGRLES